MNDYKELLPKKSSIAIWGMILILYFFIGCTVYPNITIGMGYDSCPYYCGVEHRHKTHSVDYDCEQETCIHMLKKKQNG